MPEEGFEEGSNTASESDFKARMLDDYLALMYNRYYLSLSLSLSPSRFSSSMSALLNYSTNTR